MTKKLLVIAPLCLFILSIPQLLLARGGGGGSGGGGGFGGGGGGFHSVGGSGVGIPISGTTFVIIFFVFVFFMVINIMRNIKKFKKYSSVPTGTLSSADSSWNETKIVDRVKEVFTKFQNDWSNYDIDSMKSYLTDSYWRRMVLELNVLKNEHRQNLMQDVSISAVKILSAVNHEDGSTTGFTAGVFASAHDVLQDTDLNRELYSDDSAFVEYWDFVRDGNEWKLSLIRQSTEEETLREPAIESFANRNNFYYDPDFGWLMMPNKGVLFKRSNFKTSDINNHVVGYFRNKIVEFYTFIPDTQNRMSGNYVVAQVALPLAYKDILIRKKRTLFNFSPWGLRRIETESNDFNNKFCLWADPEDQVNSFVLLAPNFMEKIYELPFELNIEVVGSFLYFYAKSRKDVDYDKMLEILSWAFDEMKM